MNRFPLYLATTVLDHVHARHVNRHQQGPPC
jgi:hypothetical protein